MLVRAGVALLYAHWEGFVRATGQLYVEFVRQKKLRYSDLSAPLLGIALKSRILALDEARAASTHLAFARFLQEEFDDRATLRRELVETHANLSSKVLRDIVTRLGLPWTPYELKEHLIDKRLVESRNTIAHGQELAIQLGDFLDLQERVVDIMLAFRADVLAAAGSGTYRRAQWSGPHG
jgi:hypothetical protein